MYIDSNPNNPQNPYKSFIVKASAGSGKTYQLSLRFFYLVLSGVDPKNIYTITFTKKAASEMKDRIYKLSSNILYSLQLQQDIINQMKVWNPSFSTSSDTIISACKKILSLDSELKISTIDSLFYDWVKLFPYESLLFDQDFFFDIASSNEIESFKTKAWTLLCESISLSIDKGSFQVEFPSTFSFIKDKGILPLKNNIESLLSYELFIWEKLFHNEKVISSLTNPNNNPDVLYYNNLGQEFFTLFKIYYSFFTQIKKDSKLLTYSDITKGVYTIFNKPEFISCRYLIHSQIQHLLIDEFQDTNKIQWNIFRSISEEILSIKNTSSSDKNTLSTVFFVGDIKQSIYGFREADPTIMLEASEVLKKYGLTTISLDYNYRSSRNLINYTNEVFSKLISNFSYSVPACDDQKDFIPNTNSSVTIFPLIENKASSTKELREKEAINICTFIKENINTLKKSTHTQSSKLNYKDIVVLYRKSTDIDIYEKVFQKYGIPFKKESSNTFFSSVEILDLFSLIKTLIFKNDLSSFAELVKSKIIDMNDTDFINFLVYNNQQNTASTSSSDIKPIYIPDYILNTYPHLQTILDYQKDFLLYSPYKLVLDLIYKLDIFNKYQSSFYDQYSSIYLNILKFLDLVYSLEQDGISSLVDIYYSLEKKSKEELVSFQNDDNAVSFMSIHKSKGLEFSMVFLIDSASSWDQNSSCWIKSYESENKDLYLYFLGSKQQHPKLIDSNISSILSNAKIYQEDELVRLLYVALTRASNHLIISGYIKDKTKVSYNYKVLTGTNISSSILSNNNKDSSNEIETSIDIDLDTKDKDLYYDSDIELLKKISDSSLDNITEISPHSLVDSVFKPYKNSDLDSLPESYTDDSSILFQKDSEHIEQNSSDLNYGTLVHKGMEFYIKNNLITESILQDISPSYMEPQTIHKAFLEIDALINSSLFIDLIKDSHLESEFRLCSLKNKVMVKGSIDLLIKKINSEDIIVIDYKTGNFDNIYYNQIKEYKNMIKDLYPNSTVRSYILKTKTIELIEIN